METGKAKALFDQIKAAEDSRREAAEAERQRGRYLDACGRVSSLGRAVKVKERADSTGFYLVATRSVPPGVPLTAFPPDLVLVERPRTCPLLGDGAVVKWEGANCNAYGPYSGEPRETVAYIANTCSVRVEGFGIVDAVAAAPPNGQPPRPDLAAHCVEDVFEDPYGGIRREEACVPPLAQATIGYLQKVAALSNVKVEARPGEAAVLVSLREIGAGERLRTGRPPLHHLEGDAALAEKIVEALLERSDFSRNSLRQMVGLPC